MIEHFPGFTSRSEKDLEQYWETAIFSYDANVLLALYRYGIETTEDMLSTMESLSQQTVMTNQAFYEFLKNRNVVISSSHSSHDILRREIGKSLDNIKRLISTYKDQSGLEVGELEKVWSDALKKSNATLVSLKSRHHNYFSDDKILRRYSKVFTTRIGKPYGTKFLSSLYHEIDRRYALRIPPGYMDAERKQDVSRYGDCIIWLQLIDIAKEYQKPIVLVTNDMKEDWWTKELSGKFTPRPELVQEMYAEAAVPIIFYDSESFIKASQKIRKRSVKNTTIAEIRKVQQEQTAASIREWERIAQVNRNILTHFAAVDATKSWLELARAANSPEVADMISSSLRNWKEVGITPREWQALLAGFSSPPTLTESLPPTADTEGDRQPEHNDVDNLEEPKF